MLPLFLTLLCSCKILSELAKKKGLIGSLLRNWTGMCLWKQRMLSMINFPALVIRKCHILGKLKVSWSIPLKFLKPK